MRRVLAIVVLGVIQLAFVAWLVGCSEADRPSYSSGGTGLSLPASALVGPPGYNGSGQGVIDATMHMDRMNALHNLSRPRPYPVLPYYYCPAPPPQCLPYGRYQPCDR